MNKVQTEQKSIVNRRALPVGWRWAKVEEVCTLVTDGTHYSPKNTGGPHPFLTVKDMTGKGIDLVSCSHIASQEFEKAKNAGACPQKGDVLFSKDGTVGKVYSVVDEISFAVLSSIAILRPNPVLLDSKFFSWALQHPSVLKEAIGKKTGSALRRIILDDIKQISLPLPVSLKEQQRIAAILTEQMAAVDSGRAAAEVQFDAAKALVAAYLRDVFNAYEAKLWPKKPLQELLLTPLKTGISKPTVIGGNKMCLTLSAVRNGLLELDASKPVELADEKAKGNWVRPGVFYVVRGNGNRSLVGRGSLAPKSIHAPILYPDLLIQVDFDSSIILGEFLALAWDSPDLRADIENRARTSAGIYKINQSNLCQVRVPVPPISEQEHIRSGLIERIKSVRRVSQDLKMQFDTINALPDALLRQAFSGAL